MPSLNAALLAWDCKPLEPFDHLPLYQQAQIYARQGIQLDRSTLADWVGRAAWHLRPLCGRVLEELRKAERLYADETTAPVLEPGKGRTKIGQLWAYARDDGPWAGQGPPIVAHVYAGDRKADQPQAHLGDFNGILQVDGYGGYAALARRPADPPCLLLVACPAQVLRARRIIPLPRTYCAASPIFT